MGIFVYGGLKLEIFIILLYTTVLWACLGVITDSEENFDKRLALPLSKLILAVCIRYSPMMFILILGAAIIWAMFKEFCDWIYKV